MTNSAHPNSTLRSKTVLTMVAMFLLSVRNYGINGLVSRSSPLTNQRVAQRAIAYTTRASSTSSSLSMAAGGKDGLPRVLLKRNRQTKSFRDGSQLVFSGSIAKEPKSLRVGDLVQIEVPSEKKKRQ
mmetsp:Transcript_15113/g.31231  ORF Transcript_15113/g.31231 Transcript_15113/m.31231 type:complete len:127 (+) Transcript_15113:133-513(+)